MPLTDDAAAYLPQVLDKLYLVIVVLIIAPVVIRVIDMLLRRIFNWTEFDVTLEKFVHKTVVTLLWFITLGVVLVILGVDLNAVIASFGIVGFIVGFALRDTLSNFAAGVMILVNKPFIVGDMIAVKEVRGRVKTVSMSNTKLVTEDNDKVTLPNSFVFGNPVTNFSAYKKKK